MKLSDKIDFSDAKKATRQLAEFDEAKNRLTEAMEFIGTLGPGSRNWLYAVYYYFLLYGKNIKKLVPVVSKLHWTLVPFVYGLATALSYQAKKLYVHEVDIDIPFIKYL